eukprot:CFRG0867T1
MDAIKGKINALKDEAHTATQRAEEAEGALREAQAVATTAENESHTLRNKVSLLEDDLEKAEEKADSMTQKANDFERRLEESERLLRNGGNGDKALDKVEELEGSIRSLKIKNDSIEMEKEVAERKIVDLQKQIEHLEDLLKEEAAKFVNLKKEHDNIIAELL